MIAFFDTTVHIDVLRGRRSVDELLRQIGNLPVRLSPVVASELLRGVTGHGARSVNKLVRRLVPLEPPSWRRCWIETGPLLPRLFPDHEEIGLGRLQNDLLLALTARHTGNLFVTCDPHFASIRRHLPFTYKTLS